VKMSGPRTVVILLLTVLLAPPPPVLAESGSVSLREAVTLALANNHLLQATRHEKNAAEFATAAARGVYLPRLLLEESGTLSNSPTRVFMMQLDQGRFSLAGDLNHPATSGDFRTALTVEQPLFDKRLGTGLDIAQNEQEQQELAWQWRREEVAFRTIATYLELQQAKRLRETAAAAVQAAQEHLRLAAARGEAGVGLKSDELRARTSELEAEQQLLSAENGILLAALRFAQVLGRAGGERVDIGEEFRTPEVTGSEEELAQAALANRLDLRKQSKGVAMADLGVATAKTAYWPTVQGVASYQLHDRDLPFGRDNDTWLAGVTLRWELFDGRQRGNRLAQARELRESATEQLAEQQQQVRLQVAESYLNRTLAGRRLEVARQAELEAAESLRLLRKRYENSLALLVEVLDVQSALNRARTQVAEMESEYARATAQLLFVAGVLLKEVQ
jgi:outer membrane protein TolC